jgi:hypothetical protein
LPLRPILHLCPDALPRAHASVEHALIPRRPPRSLLGFLLLNMPTL